MFSALPSVAVTSKSSPSTTCSRSDYLAYMLKFDSVHGRFKGSVDVKDGQLVVNGKTIRCSAETDRPSSPGAPSAPTTSSSRRASSSTKAGAEKHLTAGAKKVVMSAPSKTTHPCS